MSEKPIETHGEPHHCRVERMASGHLMLILREGEWEDFDAFAQEFLQRIDGTVLSRADSPVERVWTVRIRGEEFWLAFDDWFNHYDLSAQSAEGDAIITALAGELGARV